MGQLTGGIIAAEMSALASPQDAADRELSLAVQDLNVRYNYSLPSPAAINYTTEAGVFRARADLNVNIAQILPGGPLASNSSDYATFTLERCHVQDGGTITDIGTITTQPAGTGDWFTGMPVELGVTPASAFVSAGDVVLLRIDQAGGTVQIPPGSLIIDSVYV